MGIVLEKLIIAVAPGTSSAEARQEALQAAVEYQVAVEYLLDGRLKLVEYSDLLNCIKDVHNRA